MDKYINLALSLGATNAVAVTPNDIVFDGRTLLKCMFGCSDWGRGCTCPSRGNFLKPWELEPLLRKYKFVLIIHSPDKKIAQKASYAVEKEAYFDGDVMVFSMSDCAICATCAGKEKDGGACRDVKRARPAFHSVGIDVFATVKKLGLPLEALREEGEDQNWYAAVWLNEASQHKGERHMTYTLKKFDELTNLEVYDMLKLRQDTFIIEQDCIYPDIDNNDENAYHLLAFDDGKMIGCVRILNRGVTFEENSIGRVVTAESHRGRGIALEMMRQAMDFIRDELNETHIKISAQSYIVPLYAALGFEIVSEEYLEDDIPHVDMLCDLTKE